MAGEATEGEKEFLEVVSARRGGWRGGDSEKQHGEEVSVSKVGEGGERRQPKREARESEIA